MAISQINSNGFAPTTWTTATRPSSPFNGQQGFNSTTGYLEWYSSATSSWVQFNRALPYTVSYLIVAGGAAGGYNRGAGGGGAGGMQTGTSQLTPSLSYTVTVGAGGTGGTNTAGNSGSTSSFNSISSVGGGGGNSGGDGVSGGSGGGAGGAAGTGGTGGAATSGQGNGS